MFTRSKLICSRRRWANDAVDEIFNALQCLRKTGVVSRSLLFNSDDNENKVSVSMKTRLKLTPNTPSALHNERVPTDDISKTNSTICCYASSDGTQSYIIFPRLGGVCEFGDDYVGGVISSEFLIHASALTVGDLDHLPTISLFSPRRSHVIYRLASPLTSHIVYASYAHLHPVIFHRSYSFIQPSFPSPLTFH